MATKNNLKSRNSHYFCYVMFVLCSFSSISFIYLSSQCSAPSKFENSIINLQEEYNQSFNVLSFRSSLNQLSFSQKTPPKFLKIALFVKKWPHQNLAGGLERHAFTLHLALARRGHEVHIFTISNAKMKIPGYPGTSMKFHQTRPTPGGYLDQNLAWEQFEIQDATTKPFDVVHTESVGLFHTRARNVTHLAVSWHGIAYETIHSDIIQEILRGPRESQNPVIKEKIPNVIEEVKFFHDYQHHIATSDHVGDVLKRIYMIPEERVHIIVNGVDEQIYKPSIARGLEYRKKVRIPNTKLVIGMAGRLVKDKGHPLMFEALKQVFKENKSFNQDCVILIAGNGPWGNRYKELGSNVHVLGPLDQSELAKFYNSLDIFLNPTLRAQGLDHTFIEAMISGVPIMGTRFASVTGSLITGEDVGYTFSPTVNSLKASLYRSLQDGKKVLKKKGDLARKRAERLFTATKMAAAYERLFLCISRGEEGGNNNDYCTYPLTGDLNV